MTKETFAVAESYKRVFETIDGQTILEDLQKAFCNHTTFDVNPYTMAFLEGHRSVILRIEHLIEQANHPEAIEDNNARTSDSQYASSNARYFHDPADFSSI